MERPWPVIAAVFVGLVATSGGLLALSGFRAPGVEDETAPWPHKIEMAQPKLLVIGNSVARRSVNTGRLALELGLREPEVMNLNLADTTAPFWYTALKNRIFDQGGDPPTVVVVSDLSSLLVNQPLTDDDHRALITLLTDDEPVIAKKVYGSTSFRWLRLKQRKGDLREFLLSSVRDLSVGLTFGEWRKSWIGQGRAESKAAIERVFQAENLEWDQADQDDRELVETSDDLPSVEAGLVPDLVALCREKGAKFVYARAPMSPDARIDVVPVAKEREVVAWFNEAGAGFLDLRHLDLREGHFEDHRHMNRAGQQIFTVALANALEQSGVFGGGPILPAPPPVVASRIERQGGPGPVVQDFGGGDCEVGLPIGSFAGVSPGSLGQRRYGPMSPLSVSWAGERLPQGQARGCDGSWRVDGQALIVARPSAEPGQLTLGLDPEVVTVHEALTAVWLAPGADGVWTVDEAWSGRPGSFEVEVVAEGFGEGAGVPTLAVSGGPAEPLQAEGRRFRGSSLHEPQGSPWSVTVHNPPDGPWLAVQGLGVGRGVGSSTLLGRPSDLRGSSSRLLGLVDDRGIAPTFPREPPALPLKKSERVLVAGRGRASLFKVPRYKWLADEVTRERTSFGTRCSPLQVTEDGVPLPQHHTLCGNVSFAGRGKVCHEGESVWVSASDVTDAATNGRDYAIRLDPARACQRASWLYPGDAMVVEAPDEGLMGLRGGIRQVEVDAQPYTAEKAQPFGLVVKLTVGERVILDETVDGEIFRKDARKWLLPEPVFPGPGEAVKLTLENPYDDVFVLVTLAAVSDFSTQGATRRPPPRKTEAFEPRSVVRVGEPPEMGSLTPKRSETPCGWRYDVTPWRYLGDKALTGMGLGRASPLVVLEDGLPLRSHGVVKDFLQACVGASAHLDRVLWFSPTGDPQGPAEASRYALGLDQGVPSLRPDGEPVYWAFPGTTLEFGFDGRPQAGPFEVEIDVSTVYPDEAVLRPGPTVRAAGVTDRGVGDHEVLSFEINPDGPFVVAVEAPPGGWVVVNRLNLGGKAAITPWKVRGASPPGTP